MNPTSCPSRTGACQQLLACQKMLVIGFALLLVGYAAYCYAHGFLTGDPPDLLLSVAAALATWASWLVLAPILAHRVFGAMPGRADKALSSSLAAWSLMLLAVALVPRGVFQWAMGGLSIPGLMYYQLPIYLVALAATIVFSLWHLRRSTPVTASGVASAVPRWVLEVPTRRGCRVLDVNDVDYLRAAGNYIEVHANGTRYLLRATMRRIERELAGSPLVRTHRSYFVHVGRIESLEHCETGNHRLYLRNDVQVPVSKTYRDHVRSAMKR